MINEKETPLVNLLTDEECEKIEQLSKKSHLNIKNCCHSFRYFGLTKEERELELVKDDIKFLEETLKKWCPDLVSFSNFTGTEPNRIRCQVQYDSSSGFVGVHYLDLPTNNVQ